MGSRPNLRRITEEVSTELSRMSVQDLQSFVVRESYWFCWLRTRLVRKAMFKSAEVLIAAKNELINLLCWQIGATAMGAMWSRASIKVTPMGKNI